MTVDVAVLIDIKNNGEKKLLDRFSMFKVSFRDAHTCKKEERKNSTQKHDLLLVYNEWYSSLK